ncbi:MAG: efflux transporter outer membrane subunit, partial [Planctomycetota bacterium]
WEIDLFGRVRRSIEVAAADLDAQVEDLRGVQIALIAETVSNYLQIRSLQERIAIAAFNVESQRQSQALTDDRFRAGMTAGLDPAQAEINLFSTRATVPGLKLQLRSAIYRISVLTGRDPLTLLERLEEEQPLPQFPTSLNVGIPADLLRNRPDIRAAERRLASQTALVGVAEARRYPAVSLSGAWTWLASTADGLFDSDASETGDIGPAVSIPIFNAGRLRAQVSAEEAGVRQLELSLRALVLEAQEEVENALAAIVFDREQLEMLRGASGAASRAVELSRDLYTAGQSDFQNVLDAERSLFSLQDDVALARLSLLIDVVDLYRSLGGGWARSESDEFDTTAGQ